MQFFSSGSVMSRTALLLAFLAFGALAHGERWSTQLGLPVGIDEDLVKDFITHKDEIYQWIRSLNDGRMARLPSLTCTACKTAIGLVVSLIRGGATEANVGSALVNLCQGFNIVSDEICQDIVDNYLPAAYYIVDQRTFLKANDLCAILIQNSDCGAANETLSNWDIRIEGNKPPVLSPTPLPAGHPTVPVLQLTDIHLDLNYVVGSHSNCADPLCCRKALPENSTEATAAGPLGGYSCDFPLEAASDLFQDAASRYNYSFVLLTGDYVHHAIWATSVAENTRHNIEVADILSQLFQNTPVYPVIGNHEPHPCNMFTPSYMWDLDGHDFDLGWMYDNVATLYERNLPADALASFRLAGYYTLKTPQGLRLIVLNTNFCYTLNFWLYFDTVDPEGQLQWFADELAAAEKAGETVYVVGHVPPGHYQCWSPWAAKFDTIINRYENIIKAQFYGHTHEDDLKIFFAESASENGTAPRPTNSLYIGASATTYTDLNPGYKVYHVDGAVENRTWEILDHETFVYNLTLANLEGKTQWKKLYSAREAYALKTLRPADLYELVVKMVNDAELFQLWYRHYNKDSDTYEPCNDSECRLEYLCDIVTTDIGDQSHCNRLKSLLQD